MLMLPQERRMSSVLLGFLLPAISLGPAGVLVPESPGDPFRNAGQPVRDGEAVGH